MLYRSLFLALALCSAWGLRAQSPASPQARWADSLAGSEAAGLQQLFQLSAGQTDSLHQAALQAYNVRKQVLASYWKTDSFPAMIDRAVRLKDSLYFVIMGPRKFQIYKDSLYVQQERLRNQPTASPKPNQP